MANLPEASTFDAGIYQIEETDFIVGGVAGVSNAQAIALGNRTKFLKDQADAEAITRAAADSAEASARSSADATLTASGITLQNDINTLKPTAWVAITINTSGTPYSAGSGRAPEYKTINGVVHLRGVISASGSPPASDHDVSASALPLPSKRMDLFGLSQSHINTSAFWIDPSSGKMRANPSNGWQGTLVLDGISYSLG